METVKILVLILIVDLETSTAFSYLKHKYYEDKNFPVVNEFSTHTKIRPEVHNGRNKRALRSTLLDSQNGLHEPLLTLSFSVDERPLIVDLKRNDELLPEGHFLHFQDIEQHSTSTLKSVLKNFSTTELDLCYYQGSVRGSPKSRVALSTCGGEIDGVVYDSKETYFIHSANSVHLEDEHFLLKESDLKLKDSVDRSGPNEISNVKHGFRGSFGQENVLIPPFNSNKYSSYVELLIVVDKEMYEFYKKDLEYIHKYCILLTNVMTAIYTPLNIYIVLVGVLVWTEKEEMVFSENSSATLDNFLEYRKQNLIEKYPHDHALLLTKHKFLERVVGKSLIGYICSTQYSGSVCLDDSHIVAQVALTMAHELGHNFGLYHDEEVSNCTCAEKKCVMSSTTSEYVAMHWSSCSIDYFNYILSHGMNYCMRNVPKTMFRSPNCGNSFVELGEECDCGLPGYCQNACCDPYTCKLFSNASCATGHCCNLATCQLKEESVLCRAAENECDLPEFCTGRTEHCPSDVYKRDTEECDHGSAYCLDGVCSSHNLQCKALWGSGAHSVEVCYDKNTEGSRRAACGYDPLNNKFIPCAKEDIYCGMLHCRHFQEDPYIGVKAVKTQSTIELSFSDKAIRCYGIVYDYGLNTTNPGLVLDGAKCGERRVCYKHKCLSIEQISAMGRGGECSGNCSENGVCNSRGNCHCDIGFGGDRCHLPGPGGSVDSGSATNAEGTRFFYRFLIIFFCVAIPCAFGLVLFLHIFYRQRFIHFQKNSHFVDISTNLKIVINHSPINADNNVKIGSNCNENLEVQNASHITISKSAECLTTSSLGVGMKSALSMNVLDLKQNCVPSTLTTSPTTLTLTKAQFKASSSAAKAKSKSSPDMNIDRTDNVVDSTKNYSVSCENFVEK